MRIEFQLFAGTLGFGLLGMLLLRTLLLQIEVEGPSMTPALRSGDLMLIVKCGPWTRLRKGQVVVIEPDPRKPLEGIAGELTGRCIKRVAALGGETVILPDTTPTSQTQDRSHVPAPALWPVPRDHVFLLGDNAQASVDSKYWGPVAVERVVGVMVARIGSRRS